MAVEEAEKIEDCKICIRGSIQHRGPAVPRGVLQVATIGEPAQVSARRRAAGASWRSGSSRRKTRSPRGCM